ncbi:FAD-binding domain-containing protein [Roseateles sp.]|uniref:FAD-binding domain-containing protein n=1 Tax=Roseateles sp. TaxID=1971397 RepID=UPI00286CB588|nr:FAD-binding domain-containing protein [Roseateles sp.]
MPAFEATRAAACARLGAVQPAAYARSRNALNGAVTGLSPYITHGLLSLPAVLAGVLAREPLDIQHKFVFELGWREFFRHVWQQRGDAVLSDLHAGPLPASAYALTLPEDIRQARTGLPVIDEAVRTLYATGMLHNHARMWLASYCVHIRKLHWRCAADWLYAHLLDGDLASNHLSWQWVAGTGSGKPYLFNADNVARYAPPAWHSPGTVIDCSYEELDRLARQTKAVRPAPGARLAGTLEPVLSAQPPADLGARSPEAAFVQGREVWLLHPWSLGELPAELPPDTALVLVLLSDFHAAWPWSERRWRFVAQRVAELAAGRQMQCWHGQAADIGAALVGSRRVRSVAEPHLRPWLSSLADCADAPALFPAVAQPCNSFSQWWTRSTRGLKTAAELLPSRPEPA